MTNAPQSNVDPLATEIRRLHALGLSLFLLESKSKQPVKMSRWKSAQKKARPLPKLLARAKLNPARGLAVALGPGSGGLCCRDYDDPALYHTWAAEFPDWAKVLPTVATARGFHVYFRAVDPGRVHKVKGGEERGTGGYMVLPPSIHPSGVVYRWLVEPGVEGFPLVDPLEVGLCESGSAAPLLTPSPIVPAVPNVPAVPIRLEDAIERCRVTGKGMHDRMTLDLARYLKFHCGVSSLEAARPHFDRWWILSKGHVSDDDDYGAWAHFKRAWSVARHPMIGESIPRQTLARCRSLPPVPEEYGDERQRLLVRVCAAIHAATGGKPFKLSAAMAASALGMGASAAHVRLTELEEQGRVKSINRGLPGEGGKGRARTLLFLPLGNVVA